MGLFDGIVNTVKSVGSFVVNHPGQALATAGAIGLTGLDTAATVAAAVVPGAEELAPVLGAGDGALLSEDASLLEGDAALAEGDAAAVDTAAADTTTAAQDAQGVTTVADDGAQGLLDSSGSFGMKIPDGTTKEDLVGTLKQSGWQETPAAGGAKSGAGEIFTDPKTGNSVRVMTRPDGTSYARMQNAGGNYLTSDGQVADQVVKQQHPDVAPGSKEFKSLVREVSHFQLK